VGVREVAPPDASSRGLTPEFRRFLAGVGLFGVGDFAPTLLILAATTLLAPRLGVVGAGATAGVLYVIRNIVYAAGSYPIGAASDRFGRPLLLLAAGYLVGAGVAVGTVMAFALGVSEPIYLGLLFVGSGILAAVQDTLEAVATASLAGAARRATAFGVLGTVNGLGDLVASAGVGLVWTLASPVLAFARRRRPCSQGR